MYRIATVLCLCFLSKASIAQRIDWKKLNELNPDKILLAGERKPTKVLLLGTFHFGYPNLDAHKTDSSKFINVLSDTRQQELKELAGVIAKFKPTRVYIESRNPGFVDSLYSEYRQGRYKLGRNEIYQVGYRVAALMNHSKMYCVDASNFLNENYRKYTWIDSMQRNSPMIDTVRDKYWSSKFTELYNASDSVETTLTMLENFLLMAEPATLRRMHGAYLTDGFNTENNSGPDLLSMWWYSRNLRIFNNILKTRPGPDDRIVILFGNGHMPILKGCFQSSPEFEVVELRSLVAGEK